MGQFEEEQEMLLAMGTVLSIELVELNENIWKICLHASPFDNGLDLDVAKMSFSKLQFLDSSYSDFPLLVILAALVEMRNLEKAEQIYQQISSCKNPMFNTFLNYLKYIMDLGQMISTATPRQPTELKELCYEMRQSFQHMKQWITPHTPRAFSVLQNWEEECHLVDEMLSSSKFDLPRLQKYLPHLISNGLQTQELVFHKNLSIRDPTDMTNVTSSSNRAFELTNDEEWWPAVDQSLVKNDPGRAGLLIGMADNAIKNNRYDQAIRYYRDALSISLHDDCRAVIYNILAEVYEKQKNWLAALECYENIIGMQQLSDALKLGRAHIDAARMYSELQDYHNALVHYKRGVQIYSQHQSPRHPIVCSSKMLIGLIFKSMGDMDAAIKTFQEVIELGDSKQLKSAYQSIGTIYILKHDWEMAYYNLIQSLAISQRENPPDTDFIIDIHLDLVRVELLRNHDDEAHIHMKEAIVMSKNDGCTEATQERIQSVLKSFSAWQSHSRSHNHK